MNGKVIKHIVLTTITQWPRIRTMGIKMVLSKAQTVPTRRNSTKTVRKVLDSQVRLPARTKA